MAQPSPVSAPSSESSSDFEMLTHEKTDPAPQVADSPEASPAPAPQVAALAEASPAPAPEVADSPEASPAPAHQSLLNESRTEEEAEGQSGSTLFDRIDYLGSDSIQDPKQERAIQSQITSLNAAPERTGSVRLSVPRSSDGWVVATAEAAASPLLRMPVSRIIFFARGAVDSGEAHCFALTCVHLEAGESRAFRTHVFRCTVAEAVAQVFVSFAQAFKRTAAVALPSDRLEAFLFEVSLEIREKEEGKSGYELVPRQKNTFKLRCDVEKRVVIGVEQVSPNGTRLAVERCFGMLVSPGRNVRHADMQLLERVSLTPGEAGQGHVITGTWDPGETALAVLNRETPGDVHHVYMTIAADLVLAQVAEPVRFVFETQARMYPASERYWYFSKKSVFKQYQLRLKRSPEGAQLFDLCGIDVSEEIERGRGNSITSQLANLTVSTLGSFRHGYGGLMTVDEPLSPPCEEEDDEGGEEPMLSGFGEVSKDCSGTELDLWSQVLQEWDKDHPLQYPKQLPLLVKRGIPEALRGEVWQRMTGASTQVDQIVETYRILTTQESPDEKVILRDIHRTFPAHEFFKEAGGIGQEALYRISKAYSVYDSEIGYCQGQSFLIAALLLQMPEEQAFGVLIQVMHRLGLRDMFRENFEQLQLRLYQLDRLLEVNLPDLWQHFADNGIETHMYASQWFLTIFTAKFPLFLVFRVLDVFLFFGFDSVFQVALGILKVSKKDMLLQDFEGLMKYFRVNIPKRYRSEDNAKYLMEVAMGIKIKRLNKYEKEWLQIKAAERAREDPVIRLERENKKLLSENLRLDTENDNLARQLVNSKIEMRKEIDIIEDEKDHFEKEATSAKLLIDDTNEENKRLHEEVACLKEVLKREVDKSDAELATKTNVIAEYKVITSQLSEKLEKLQSQAKELASKHKKMLSRTNSSSSPSQQPPEDQEGEDQICDNALNDSGNLEDLDKANERIRELELELAQTKLALVETECRLQDVNHHMSAFTSQDHQGATSRSGTWFSKTLTSIKESASQASGAREALRKSTSVDVLKGSTDFPTHQTNVWKP